MSALRTADSASSSTAPRSNAPTSTAAVSTATVSIAVVTHNSAADRPGCLSSIVALDHRPLEVVLVDCGSQDHSASLASEFQAKWNGREEITVLALDPGRNLGFAGGMNLALAQSQAPFVLSLNADARPSPDYLDQLLAILERTERPGAATGRLLRPEKDGERRIDACGMRLTRNWRHLDRGSGEVDRGQLATTEEVFGATGAASLFVRKALEDVSLGEEIFDPAFHSFREDAELCFRLQERGWVVLYAPQARCEHRRFNLPMRRRQMPAAVNYHSLKNRYLLRLYHQSPGNFLRTLPATLFRDLQALVYVILFERSSLPAYGWLWRQRKRILERRRWIQRRRSAPRANLERWFRHQGLPL